MSLWRLSDYYWATCGITTQAEVKRQNGGRWLKGVACPVPQRLGRSFDFWGIRAGHFRYKQEKWTPSISPIRIKIYISKSLIFGTRKDRSFFFNWSISAMTPLPSPPNPPPLKNFTWQYNLTNYRKFRKSLSFYALKTFNVLNSVS